MLDPPTVNREATVKFAKNRPKVKSEKHLQRQNQSFRPGVLHSARQEGTVALLPRLRIDRCDNDAQEREFLRQRAEIPQKVQPTVIALTSGLRREFATVEVAQVR